MNNLQCTLYSLIISLFLIILTPNDIQAQCTPLSGIYTIGGSTPDFSGFTEAVDSLTNCGVSGAVTIIVAPNSGPYNEQIEIPSIPGASATKTIIFNGNGETLQFNPTTDDRHLIRLNGAKHIKITDLQITGTGSVYGYGIHFMNQADSNSINNCTINLSAVTSTSTSGSAGIAFSASTTSLTSPAAKGINGNHNSITNNTIIGAYTGIRMFGNTAFSRVDSNILTGNTIKDFVSYGIYLHDTENCKIMQNDISRGDRFSVGTFYGIYLTGGNQNNYLAGNRIHNTHDNASSLFGSAYAFYFTDTDAPPGLENFVVNNLIYNFNNNGTIRALYNSGSDGVYYYHNTISLDNIDATGFTTTQGFYQTVPANNLDFRNNIISIKRGGTGTKHCFYLSDTSSNIIADHNILFIDQDSTSDNHVAFYNGNQTDFSDWQSVNNNAFAQNSIFADPVFLDLAADDFTPLNTGINNTGAPMGINQDINMSPRNSLTPDPGAIEFTPVQFDAGVTAVIEPFEDICGADNIPVRIQVTNFGFDTLNNVQVTSIISGPLSDTLTATSGTIDILSNDTVYLGDINFPAGGNLNFTTFVAVAGDTINSNDTLVSIIHINTAPGVILANPYMDTVCRGVSETINLVNDTTLSYKWYDSEIGGNIIAQGATHTTPPLDSPVNYYVEALARITGTVGKPSPSENASIYVDGWGLVFNVLDNITLDTVHVYPQSAGTLTLQVVNDTSLPITDSISFVFDSMDIGIKQALHLGFNLNPGNGYRIITLPSSTVTGMRRDNSGNDFPYEIPNTIEIIGSYNGTATPAVYYWFYDWKITYLGCPVERAVLPVFVDTFHAPVLPAFSYSVSGQGLEVDFTPADTASGNNYMWQFGDGASSNLKNANHTYQNDSIYTACLFINNSCSEDSSCQTFTVCENLTSSFAHSRDSLIVNFSFTGQGTPTSYLWYFDDDSGSSIANPSHSYLTDGIYDVTLVAENLCGEKDTITLAIEACAFINADYTFEQQADGLTFDFSDQSSGNPNAYYWSFGDGMDDSTANPTYSFEEFGTYNTTLFVTNICQETESITKAVNACLENIAAFAAVKQDDRFTFEFNNNSTGSDLTYQWNFGDGNTSNDQQPMHTYETIGSYNIILVTTDACGFTDTATASIKIAVGIENNGNGSDSFISIYPNPNDGQFIVSILLNRESEVQFRIVDLLGKVVMESSLKLSSGGHDLNLEIVNEPKGIYFLKYKIENQTGVNKIILD